MLSRKSVLARLLANENITVQQGNFPTAYFDVENRVLGLPLWKEMSADLYDLMVGHEVGHALYTPNADVLTEASKLVPFSYINVVEDIRIEKAVLARYPGLVSNFKRGYVELVEMDLFGTKDRDINKMGFMDRLNLKAKGRDLVEIEFSEEELPYFNKAMAVETFDEVQQVCGEIAKWLSEKKDENRDQDDNAEDDSSGSEESNEMGDPSDESDEGGSDADDSGETADDEDGDENKDDSAKGTGEVIPEDNDGETSDQSSPSQGSDSSDDIDLDSLPEVETENAQQKNMEKLSDSDNKLFVQGMTRSDYQGVKIGYKQVIEGRLAVAAECAKMYAGLAKDQKARKEELPKFLAETKQVVNLMAKEFDMRKAAYRSQRARTSTKGSINVNKLHAYKYDDNMFKQVTMLADGKSHGMIMMVDYSGSMYKSLEMVIRQTIALVMFCKRVQIPFEVYSFGSDNKKFIQESSSRLTHFNFTNLRLAQIFSSDMSKADLNTAIESMFCLTLSNSSCPSYIEHCSLTNIERLGTTPLNAALLAMEFAIKDFTRKNPVQKMNLITLTDGDSDHPTVVRGTDMRQDAFGVSRWNRVMEINGKRIELNMEDKYRENHNNTALILKAIAGKNVTTANFYITNRGGFHDSVSRTFPYIEGNGVDRAKAFGTAKALMKAHGTWIVDNVDGYDRRFVVLDNTASMSAENDAFSVDKEATPAQIAKAFKKYSGSKKGNRLLTQRFAELLA